MTRKIIILEMGPTADELIPKYGKYSSLFESLLADGDFEFETLDIYAGDALPKPTDADGFILTGSKHGVYENLPWMLETQEFIRQAAAAKIPMVGICFGHQIMAQAMGGEVIKSPKGWGLGVMEYEVKADTRLQDAPAAMTFNAVHQDQVIKKPEDADVFASSDFCEYAGLIYGGDNPYAITLQPHPEFDKDYTSDLIKVRRGTSFPEDKSDEGIASQSHDINNREWGQVLVSFFQNNIEPRD